MSPLRHLAVVLLAVAITTPVSSSLHAGDAGGDISTPDKVVDKGIAALIRLQQPNGSFDAGAGITALCGMALLSGGHTPTRGAHQVASRKALDELPAGRVAAGCVAVEADPW